ncbi:TAXI family TRAP transporter solute-binding subunit [Desulfobaculum senezii]
MKGGIWRVARCLVALAVVACLAASPALAKKSYIAFGGGPVGGTFNYFANAMANHISQTYDDLEITPEGSGGSASNLKRLHKGHIEFGIVYSGDAYLGRHGRLPQDTTRYDNARAVAYLYGAPAHLVVRKDSGITAATDLVGKRVGIGNAGSGAAAAAERFFRHIGIWDKIKRLNMGYSAAATAFSAKKIDAFWVLAGEPNASVIEASARSPIALVDLHKTAVATGFYDVYPFYTPIQIPGGTYRNLDSPVKSFQDAAYWCANARVSNHIVHRALSSIFSAAGLRYMTSVNQTAKAMNIVDGLKGLSIPIHPGAARFWEEQGLNIPTPP